MDDSKLSAILLLLFLSLSEHGVLGLLRVMAVRGTGSYSFFFHRDFWAWHIYIGVFLESGVARRGSGLVWRHLPLHNSKEPQSCR